MDYSRYARQMVLPNIGQEGQQKLSSAHVAVVGCGALGTVAADLLVRSGVGGITIIDRDVVELTNLQRQTLFDEADAMARRAKAVAAAEKLSRVNSQVQVRGLAVDFTWRNARELLRGHDLVIDATDNHLARLTINDACLEEGIPFIYGGALGYNGMTMNILPGGPCYRCLIDDIPPAGAGDSCDVAGVLGAVTAVVAANQTSEAIKYLVDPASLRKGLLDIDLLRGTYRTIQLPQDPNCPACVQGRRDFLSPERHQESLVICGRNSVMLQSPNRSGLNLLDLAAVLGAKGHQCLVDRFRLRLMIENYEMILFADGRALINGTEDPAVAKRVYSGIMGG
ncbi:MAG TPA: ThiF family adenylyltransferase [Bacillota bacterium]|nr:ThiF family adenylyltransferase [Bacillota bacterium]